MHGLNLHFDKFFFNNLFTNKDTISVSAFFEYFGQRKLVKPPVQSKGKFTKASTNPELRFERTWFYSFYKEKNVKRNYLVLVERKISPPISKSKK